MNTRWTRLRHIDSALPLTRDNRRTILIRSNKHAGKVPGLRLRLVIVSLLVLGVGIGGSMPLMWWLARTVPLHPFVAVLGYILICVFCAILYAQIVYSWYARPTRLAVRDTGFEICLGCGYWLRELESGVKHCPECGEVREAMP